MASCRYCSCTRWQKSIGYRISDHVTWHVRAHTSVLRRLDQSRFGIASASVLYVVVICNVVVIIVIILLAALLAFYIVYVCMYVGDALKIGTRIIQRMLLQIITRSLYHNNTEVCTNYIQRLIWEGSGVRRRDGAHPLHNMHVT